MSVCVFGAGHRNIVPNGSSKRSDYTFKTRRSKAKYIYISFSFFFFCHMWYNILLMKCFINSWETYRLQVSEESWTIYNLHTYVIGFFFKGGQEFKSCPVGDELFFKKHSVFLFA